MDEIDPYKFQDFFENKYKQQNVWNILMDLLEPLQKIFEFTYYLEPNDGLIIEVDSTRMCLYYNRNHTKWVADCRRTSTILFLTSLTDIILSINSISEKNIQNKLKIMNVLLDHIPNNVLHIYGCRIRIIDRHLFIIATNLLQGPEYYILDQNNPDFNRPIFMSKKKRAIINYLIHNIRRPDN